MNTNQAEDVTDSWVTWCLQQVDADSFGGQLQSFKTIDDDRETAHRPRSLGSSRLKQTTFWEVTPESLTSSPKDSKLYKKKDTSKESLQRLFTFKAHVHKYTSSLKCRRWNTHSLSGDNTYCTLWRWLWLSGVLAGPTTEWPPTVMTPEWPEGEEETVKLKKMEAEDARRTEPKEEETKYDRVSQWGLTFKVWHLQNNQIHLQLAERIETTPIWVH